MKRLSWALARWLEVRGRWQLPVFVAFVFMAVFYFSAIIPAQHQLARAQRHHADLSVRKTLYLTAAHAAEATADIPAIIQSLPSYRTVPQALSRIFSLAKDLDVALDIGDYRYHRNRGEMFGRYQIELPLVTDYPTLRVLIARLMNDMPFAAIDDISLVREDVESDVVEARLRITLFLSER